MKATIREAEMNERNLTIRSTGYGQYKLTIDYRGKEISCHSTNSIDVDNFKSDFGDIEDGFNRIKLGYTNLCSEVIRKNN